MINLVFVPVWDAITPPLSLAYLKSNVEIHGVSCKTIDLSTELKPIMLSAAGDTAAEDFLEKNPDLYKQWAKKILENSPSIVGFSVLDSNINNTKLVADEIRRLDPSVTLIAGGNCFTLPEVKKIHKALEYVDYVIEGEAESNLIWIIRAIESNSNIKKEANVWFKLPTGTVVKSSGEYIQQDLNTLEYPDFTDFDRTLYKEPDTIPLMFSRGCILNCTFCSNKFNHKTQRTRTGENVYTELQHQIKKYNAKSFMLNDDSLISHITYKELEKFCDLIIESGNIIPWRVYGTRIERLLNEKYVNKLADAGMAEVQLGVESLSTKVQRSMGKSSTYEEATRCVELFCKSAVSTSLWIIYGYPTETDEDFYQTVNWVKNNPNYLGFLNSNTFGANDKYLKDRSGEAVYYGHYPWSWASKESTIEKRKKRFLEFIEVLENEKQKSTIGFKYSIGDPLYVKYFTEWNEEERRLLFSEWERVEKTAKFYEDPKKFFPDDQNFIQKLLG